MEQPEHPDLYLIAQAILDLEECEFPDIADAFADLGLPVDYPSVRFVAMQRALHLLPDGPAYEDLRIAVAVMWAEGMIIGIKVAEMRASGAHTAPDTPEGIAPDPEQETAVRTDEYFIDPVTRDYRSTPPSTLGRDLDSWESALAGAKARGVLERWLLNNPTQTDNTKGGPA